MSAILSPTDIIEPLESEDVKGLKDFYKENGFTSFGKRVIDKEEKLKSKELIQWIKRLDRTLRRLFLCKKI